MCSSVTDDLKALVLSLEARVGSLEGGKAAVAKPAPKPAAAEEEDDDVDLFGSEDEEESKEDTDPACMRWHMKQNRHSTTGSQGNYIKKVVFKNQYEPYVEKTVDMQNKELCVKRPLNNCTKATEKREVETVNQENDAGESTAETNLTENAESNPAGGVAMFIEAAEEITLNMGSQIFDLALQTSLSAIWLLVLWSCLLLGLRRWRRSSRWTC